MSVLLTTSYGSSVSTTTSPVLGTGVDEGRLGCEEGGVSRDEVQTVKTVKMACGHIDN